MQQIDIFQPFLALMFLTFAVWVYMYIRRTAYLVGNRVDLRKVDTPEKMAQQVPDSVALPAHNLKNLFELPILFYALCLLLFVTDSVDTLYLIAAWWFVAFRIFHSAIHCTFNKVILRFATYFLSAIALWIMMIRYSLQLFGLV